MHADNFPTDLSQRCNNFHTMGTHYHLFNIIFITCNLNLISRTASMLTYHIHTYSQVTSLKSYEHNYNDPLYKQGFTKKYWSKLETVDKEHL